MSSENATAWRVSDVVAYEAMRELASDAIAGIIQNDEDRAIAIRFRAEALLVDPGDRSSVDRMSERLREQLKSSRGTE